MKRFPVPKRYREILLHPLRRKEFTALRGINLQVRQGEIFGLLGPNGAGKTTLSKILCTLILPTEGQARTAGFDISTHSKEVRKRIGFIISEERSFFWRLTGRQNLHFFATLNNMPHSQIESRVNYLLELVGLEDRADKLFNSYSTGMKQRLAIARGLLTEPEILFMDEPTRSLDPAIAYQLRRFVKEELVAKQGKTVFLATHILEEAEYMCDRIAIIHQGKICAVGTPNELRWQLHAETAYQLEVNIASDDLLWQIRQIEGISDVVVSEPFVDDRTTLRIATRRGEDNLAPTVVETAVKTGAKVMACYPVQIPLAQIIAELAQDWS